VADGIAATADAPVPQLEWGTCPAAGPEEAELLRDYQCTTAEVPLSYRDPHGQSIELALGRLPAANPSQRLGTLFWNPGGPGGSGRIPPVFSEALHQRFDLVGFDPRGIAASTPVRCFASNEQALELFGWEFPITLAQERDVIRRTALGTGLCARNGGPLLSHMSTANVARDLDLLRQAVGDRQLTYLGYSYGTAIGEYYANLFPDNVRALTLDAVIDPVEWTTGRTAQEAFVPVEYRMGSFLGANRALGTFLAECARDERCAFREAGVDLRRKYDRLLARLRRNPAQVTFEGETVLVTYQTAVSVTLGLLYFAPAAPLLADLLQAMWQATEQPVGRGAARQAAGTGWRPARAPAGRQDEPYLGLEWFSAVECTDSANPSDPWLWPRYARRADRVAGPFGSPWIYGSLPCATWPASDPDRYTGPWDRPTANPILLIGNRQGDPATPYEDAQSTERELASARLLTLDSYGHTAQGGLSRCIDDAVDAYLIELRLPPPGQVCQPDLRPFDPLPAPLARRRQEREQRLPRPPIPLVDAIGARGR